jgi:hypothetical protein
METIDVSQKDTPLRIPDLPESLTDEDVISIENEQVGYAGDVDTNDDSDTSDIVPARRLSAEAYYEDPFDTVLGGAKPSMSFSNSARLNSRSRNEQIRRSSDAMGSSKYVPYPRDPSPLPLQLRGGGSLDSSESLKPNPADIKNMMRYVHNTNTITASQAAILRVKICCIRLLII